MTVGINEDITAAQYEILRGKAARVLGQPSGSWSTASIGTVAGYDQNPDAPIKLPADLITAADWNKLHSDISRCYFHIVGSEPSIDEVATDELITADTYNAYEAIADFNVTNRNTVASTQRSLATATVASLTSTWNGVQKHAFTVTWNNEAHKEGWINAGGTLRFSASASYSGSQAKSQDWVNIIGGVGVIDINNMSMTETGDGTLQISQAGPSYNGWWYIDSLSLNTEQTIYATSGADQPNYTEYDENFYEIKVIKRSSTQYEFQVIVNDADVGGGAEGADDNVETDINSLVQVFTASGANVALATPTFAEKTPTNTFNYS